MAANQNITLLYFCRNLFRYHVDGERNRAMSKHIEVNSACAKYTPVAQPHNIHSIIVLNLQLCTTLMGTTKVLYFLSLFP